MTSVERIPGVFPIIEIERDADGWARKVRVKGVMDELVITAMISNTPNPWLDVKLNGEEYTIR